MPQALEIIEGAIKMGGKPSPMDIMAVAAAAEVSKDVGAATKALEILELLEKESTLYSDSRLRFETLAQEVDASRSSWQPDEGEGEAQ